MSKKLGDRVKVWPVVVHGKPKWQVATWIDGSRTTRVYSTEEEAEEQREIYEAAIKRGQIDAPSTWQEAVDIFITDRKRPAKRRPDGARKATTDQYTKQLGIVARVLGGDPDPLTLTIDDAFTFMAQRRTETNKSGEPISAATIVGEVEAVTIMQRLFVAKGWIPVATWGDPEVARPEIVSSKRVLKPDEIGRFVRAAIRLGEDPAAATNEMTQPAIKSERRKEDWERWPAAVWLMMHGACTGELEHLLGRDMELVTGSVEVVDRIGARTKTKARRRTIPILLEEALACLRETFRDLKPAELAFPVHTRAPPHGQERKYDRSSWFATRCRITCELAGIEPVSPHELRHTVATLAAIAGADIESIASLLGNSARMIRQNYSHATSVQKSMGAAKVVSQALQRFINPVPDVKVVRRKKVG